MTVSFEGIEVRTVLQLIADTSRRNIVVSDAVAGTVTVSVKDVPWDQLLDIVLNAKGLQKRVQNGVIWVFNAGEQGPLRQ
jgi:type IV pilus assembly protein PilQ